ncbi:MAG TPA: protein kinase [Steroidobacteraceae bacterium]
MTLAPGFHLGTYEVLGSLGAGGMGEVFRARDSRLGRDVALKVLSGPLRGDAERLTRLEREGRVLASLNHPNIATLYAIEELGDTHAPVLILELIEGETLAERVARGPLPPHEAAAIAGQIAAALEAAHEHGVVHRDLKPANIKLRADGTVKVLDFGIARVLSDSTERRDPHLATITASGLVTIGTPAYMSPEQTRGLPVDKRADIWAFGCVLYEMLTSARAFPGEQFTDIVARVIEREPDLATLPAHVPTPLVRLLRRCLEKDPRQRLRDIGDARLELADLEARAHEPTASTGPSRTSRPVVALCALGLAAIAVAAGLLIGRAFHPDSARVTRFSVIVPRAQVVEGGAYQFVALSPQATHLAYIANGRIFVRATDTFDLHAVPGSENQGPLSGLLFSPDGQWIAFHSSRSHELRKVPLAGGSAVRLATAEAWLGGSWGADDTIVFAQTSGIFTVAGTGGAPTLVTGVDRARGELAMNPVKLPGGRGVLFTLQTSDPNSARAITKSIVLQPPGNAPRRVLIERGADARYIDSGHLVYADQRSLLVVPFDLHSLAVTGTPLPITTQLGLQPINASADFAVSENGSLAYGMGAGGFPVRTLSWIDRHGSREPLGAPARSYDYVRVSPDGTRILASLRDEAEDIFTWDLRSRTFTRLTFNPEADTQPVWTRDGKGFVFVAFNGGKAGLVRKAADGTGPSEQLNPGDLGTTPPNSITPDGTQLLFRQITPERDSHLWLLPLDHRGAARPLLKSGADELNGEISPDGHWLAYQSNESGSFEIYLRPFPRVEDGKWQVSNGGGIQPAWGPDGHELFYLSARRLLALPVRFGPTPVVGAAQVVIAELSYAPFDRSGRTYDVSSDGQRFLVLDAAPSVSDDPFAGMNRIDVVLDWARELKQ